MILDISRLTNKISSICYRKIPLINANSQHLFMVGKISIVELAIDIELAKVDCQNLGDLVIV